MKWGFDSLTANNKPVKVKRARDGQACTYKIIFIYRELLVNLKSVIFLRSPAALVGEFL